MSEYNLIENGRFESSLDQWTVDGAEFYVGDGDEHYGVAVLGNGESISQDFQVYLSRRYTLHFSLKPNGGSVVSGSFLVWIGNGNGGTVAVEKPVASANVWTDFDYTFGLAGIKTYSVNFTNVNTGANVYIDDVWVWDVLLSRMEAAKFVHSKIGKLALDAGLSTTPNGNKTEGDYTDAVDIALMTVGAVNPETGVIDIRYLPYGSAKNFMREIEREMLEMLRRNYALEVDVKAGPVSESLSQKSKAIGEIVNTDMGDNEIGTAELYRGDNEL